MKNENLLVKVDYEGGGWYKFSPSGHAYYNNHDEITVQGLKALKRVLREFNLSGICNKKVIN